MAVAQSRIYSLFNEALAIETEADREQYLDHACGDDPVVRSRVEVLLRAHAAAGGFLGGQSPETLTGDDFPTTASIGTSIGPYKLREVLGEGGMGIVYAAEQEQPIRRKVALKVIKPGMDSKEIIARLETERQALALMDHPHIAKVLDAGSTDSGRPYFVMELVRGLPITRYCDQANLNLRERLRLFISVCQAVQHAHQKGIIHRDLKPSNVMITLHDGTPVPKVIDFGVAKALNQKLTDHTLYTRHAQLLGTPMYMSPEQAELSGLDIDTRSDVYALGVLLYELLTGRTPFDRDSFSQAGYDEQRRMIREEEPPRPSQRVSTLAGEQRTTIAVQRGLDDRQLAKSLRGELDWIVMKALEKDRTRRYGSADALAADLQCYLNDQPVQACPPSWTYRMQKFVHRQRGTISATALAVCFGLVLAGVIVYIKDRTGNNVASVVVPDGGTVTITDDQKLADAVPTAKPPSRASAPGRYLPGLIPEPTHVMDIGRWQMITKKPRHVEIAVWSPDERRIALQDYNNVRIYDSNSLGLLHVLVAHSISVFSIAWHPEGKRLATGDESGDIRLWTSDGAPTHLLTGHKAIVFQLAWRPDGELLASASADGTVRLWNANGDLVRVLDEGGRHVFGIDWSPDGKLLASVGGDYFPLADAFPRSNAVRIWNAETGSLIQEILSAAEASGLCVDWRPDGEQLAVGFGVYIGNPASNGKVLDAGLYLWNRDGTPGPDFGHKLGRVNAVAWYPDGKRLAYSCGGVHVWNAENQSITNANIGAETITRSQEGHQFLVADSRWVREWDGDQQVEFLIPSLARDVPVGQAIGRPKWSPDGSMLSGGEGKLFWNADGQPVEEPPSPDDYVPPWWKDTPYTSTRRPDGTPAPALEGLPVIPWPNANAWSRQGWFACTVSAKSPTVHIWDDRGKLIAPIRGHHTNIGSVSWSPDGEWLATGGDDTIRLWKKDGTPGPVITVRSEEIGTAAWSPDGQWIASCGAGSPIRLWKPNGSAGPVLHDLEYTWKLLAWSPDSQKIARTSSRDNLLRVWDVASGKVDWVSLRVQGEKSVTFNASGELLYGDRESLESSILYLVEKQDGAMDVLTFGEFQQRYGASLAQARTDRVSRLIQDGTLDEAIVIFDRMIADDPKGDLIWPDAIGDSFLQHQYYQRAVVVYSSIIKWKSSWGHLFKRRGAAYMGLKEYDKALADITTAVEMTPGDASNFTWFPQSLLWESPQEIQDAFLALVTKAIERSPANYAVRAQYFFHRREFEKGRADIAAALEAGGNDPKLLNNSAWQFVASDDLELQRSEVALQWAERAVELAPGTAAYWHTLGVARFRQSDWSGALNALKKSMELGSGGSGYDWFFLAMIHWQLGQPDEAAKWYDQSVEWMSQQKPNDELIRFQAEAAKMLGRTTPGP